MFSFENLYKILFHASCVCRVLSKGVASKDVDVILDKSTDYFDKDESDVSASDKG